MVSTPDCFFKPSSVRTEANQSFSESVTFTLREHWAADLPKGYEYASQRPWDHSELSGKVPFKYVMHGALLWRYDQAVHKLPQLYFSV